METDQTVRVVHPYGYYTDAGYKGLLPNGKWQLFENDREYFDTISDQNPNCRFVSSSC